jgi:hypothetical protein
LLSHIFQFFPRRASGKKHTVKNAEKNQTTKKTRKVILDFHKDFVSLCECAAVGCGGGGDDGGGADDGVLGKTAL